MGRSTKLIPERQTKICDYVRNGSYFEVACEASGVDKQTGHEWMARGQGTHGRPTLPIYAEFAAAIKRAEAEAEERSLLLIRKAAEGGDIRGKKITTTVKNPDGSTKVTSVIEEYKAAPEWTAAAWLNERRFRQRWGRYERMEHSGPDGSDIKVQIDLNAVDQIIERAKERAGASSGD